MIFVGLPLLKEKYASHNAPYRKHHKRRRKQQILPSKNALSSEVDKTIAFPIA